MKTFEDFMTEKQNILQEKAISIGGKMYQKFNQVVIMAGGAGSGKGFVKDNLLGIEGMGFDVDELKQSVLKSSKMAADILRDTGIDVKKFNLSKSNDVQKLHDIVSNHIKLDKKNLNTKFSSIATADPRRKPNLIFDVTLKGLSKLESISRNVQELGYNKEDISIVWVVNDMKVAMKQNSERERKVPEEILIDTHKGASQTMLSILKMGNDLTKYMDGDIWLAFNKRGVDSKIKSSESGGFYIVDANYIQVKKKGKSVKSISDIDKEVLSRIKDYTPSNDNW